MKIVLSWWKQNYTLQKKKQQTNKKKLSHFSEKCLKPKEAILTLELSYFHLAIYCGHSHHFQSPISETGRCSASMAGVMGSGLKDYRVQVLVIVSVSCPLARYSSFKPLLSNAEYKIMTPKLPDMCMYINILYAWWSGGVLPTMDWYFVQNEYSCFRTCDKLSQLFKLVLFICSLFATYFTHPVRYYLSL